MVEIFEGITKQRVLPFQKILDGFRFLPSQLPENSGNYAVIFNDCQISGYFSCKGHVSREMAEKINRVIYTILSVKTL